MESESLQSVFDDAFDAISQVREAFTPQLMPQEVGTITSVATGIAKVSGLPGVGFDELVVFPGDVLGIAFNVDADEIGVVLLGEYWHLHAGDEVRRMGRVMDVAVVATSGRMAFDSLVQRDAPDANRGRSFATFELRFQLVWVVGAVIPVLVSIPVRAGFLVIAGVAGFALFSYVAGQRAAHRAHATPQGGDVPAPPVADPTVADHTAFHRPPTVDPTTIQGKPPRSGPGG
jgi:F-type H+-transporting ATPase subunit alpha